MNPNTNCPACGFPKEIPDKPLCFYCYFRGSIGTMKMLILDIFYNSPTKLTIPDLMDILNDKEYIGKPVNRALIKKLLTRYTHLKLLSASKERLKHRGRKKLRRMITKRGKKRLLKYKKNWELGLPVIIRKRFQNFKMTSEYRERASAIRGKIGKEYDTYAYILPQRKL